MKRPLVFIAVFFCAGTVLKACCSNGKLPVLYTSSWMTLVLAFLLSRKKQYFLICLCALLLLLGATAFEAHTMVAHRHIRRLIDAHSESLCTVEGFVAGEAKDRQGKHAFLFESSSIERTNLRYDCCGSIKVLAHDKPSYRPGEALRITGYLSCPSPFNRRIYGPFQKIKDAPCQMQVLYPEVFIVPGKGHRFLLERLAVSLKQRIETLLSEHTSLTTAAVLKAMILGEKSDLAPFLYDSMIKTGTVHILVVSGFNVGIVTFIVMLLLKVARIPRRARIMLTAPLLLCYCLVTGASSPVVRATLMALLFLFSYPLKKEADILTTLACAALAIIGFDPRQLFDIGFQLSFSSVFSIVVLYPRIRILLKDILPDRRWLKYVAEGFLVSLSAWIGTGGIIAWNFRIFSPVTAIANIVIVPLASLLTLSGFSIVATQLIAPALAPFIASSSEILVLLLVKMNACFLSLPGAYVQW